MLAIRNGTKSILRTPAKAALYCLIILLVASLVSVAICVNSAVNGYLADCEEYYHTVANVEYIGEDYPDIYAYDEKLSEALEKNRESIEALLSEPSVKYFDPRNHEIAMVKGLHRNDPNCFDPDAGIVCVHVKYYDKPMGAYVSTITDTRYSKDEGTGKVLMIMADDPSEREGEALKIDHYYLICGQYVHGINGYLWFKTESAELTIDGETVTVPAFKEVPPSNTKDKGYDTLAKLMAQRNDSCQVEHTPRVEDQFSFHQDKQKILDGRFFSDEEYETDAKVCMIPETLAEMMSLKVGDKIPLSIIGAEGDIYGELRDIPEDVSYEIVGIYSRNDEDPYKIFLPDSGSASSSVTDVNGYTIGQFGIDNSSAADFLNAAKPLESKGFRITLYDQGYNAVVEPMLEMQLISRIFLAVCLMLAVAVLCLHSYMFITRQRESAEIMMALGSGKRHVALYFIACSAMVAIPGIFLGCLIGSALDKLVYSLIGKYAAGLATTNLNFSSSMLSLTRQLEFASGGSLLVYLLAALLMIAAAVILSLVFTFILLNGPEKKKKKRRLRVTASQARHSSHLKTKLKYALISMRRLRARSFAVIVLAIMVVMFVGQLNNSLEGYKAELDNYNKNTVLKGHATDSSGQKIDSIIVYKDAISAMISTGKLEDYCFSDNLGHVRFLGISETADGKKHKVDVPRTPKSMFEVETLFSQMIYEPTWNRTSSIEGNSRFYYTGLTNIEWLEGYSEEAFEGGMVCVIPQEMQKEYGIELGDTVKFLNAIRYFDMPVTPVVDLKVVGVYLSSDVDDAVFSPMDLTRIKAPFGYEGDGRAILMDFDRWWDSYSSFTFTIKDATNIGEIRQAFEDSGFTYVNSKVRMRSYVIIDDNIYVGTSNSMKRQIVYTSIMNIVLYVMAGLMGIVAAWLMVSSRRYEVALMRALGAQPMRIIMNFSFEQTALCFVGIAAGLLIYMVTRGSIEPMHLILSAAFFALWVISSIICAVSEVKKQSSPQLTEPE